MTPEQLEAHRVRFEQQYADYKLWPVVVVYSRRSVYSDTYDHIELQAAWQAYQWALADTDRAQRAAPGVQGGEVRFGGRCEKHLSPKPCAACAQPPQQSAQPVVVITVQRNALVSASRLVGFDALPDGDHSLYTAAQPVEVQRVPLTGEQLRDIARQYKANTQHRLRDHWDEVVALVRDAEAAHGIKPTSSEGGT